MRLFLVRWDWSPSDPEATVVLADNKKRAIQIAEEDGYGGEDCDIASIIEIDLTIEGAVYTGHYCC